MCVSIGVISKSKIRVATAISQCAVCIHQLPERHIGGSKRQGGAVVVALLDQAAETESSQSIREHFDADHVRRAHGRHVQRRRQRGAHRDQAPELAIVVERAVNSALLGQFERSVFDQRCGSEQMLVHRERVEERLESRTGLARRADGVEVGRVRKIAGTADIRPYFASGILDDDHRAVIDASIANVDDLAMQCVDDEALEFAIEGASRGSVPAVQQTLGEMGRECDSRVVAAAARECAVERRGNRGSRRARRSAHAAECIRANRDRFAARIRRPNQRGEHGGFGRVDSVWQLCRTSRATRRRRPATLRDR